MWTPIPVRGPQASEQLAWLKGRHSVKFSFDYLRVLYRRLDCNDCPPYLFRRERHRKRGVSGRNGSIDASFLLGHQFRTIQLRRGHHLSKPVLCRIHSGRHPRQQQVDREHQAPLRLIDPEEERNKNNSNFNPALPNPGAGGLLGATEFAGSGPGRSGKDRFGETKKNAFGPRLGIAYQLTSKTVIRTGGSVYYQPTREDGNADRGTAGFGGWFFTNGLSRPRNRVHPTKWIQPDGGFGERKQAARHRSALGLYSTPFYFFPKAGRSPYFTDYMFTVENSVTANSIARVSYHANLGHKLLSRVETMNQLDPKYLAIYGNLLGRRLDDPLVVATGFKLPTRVTRRVGPCSRRYGLTHVRQDQHPGGRNERRSYDLSCSGDEFGASLLPWTVPAGFVHILQAHHEYRRGRRRRGGLAQNTYNLRAEKRCNAGHHTTSASFVYEVPIGKGKRWLSGMHPVAMRSLATGRCRLSIPTSAGQRWDPSCPAGNVRSNGYRAIGRRKYCSGGPGNAGEFRSGRASRSH
ncbi:MAG: hypothetical protein WKF37_19880 [Bryobacteraceae bacterium]